MKKFNLRLLAVGLLATVAISGCSYQTRETNRRPPRHDRHHRDHHDDRRGDHYYRY